MTNYRKSRLILLMILVSYPLYLCPVFETLIVNASWPSFYSFGTFSCLVYCVMCLSSLEQGGAVVRLKQNTKSCIMNGVSSMGVYQYGDRAATSAILLRKSAQAHRSNNIKSPLVRLGAVSTQSRVWFDST